MVRVPSWAVMGLTVRICDSVSLFSVQMGLWTLQWSLCWHFQEETCSNHHILTFDTGETTRPRHIEYGLKLENVLYLRNTKISYKHCMFEWLLCLGRWSCMSVNMKKSLATRFYWDSGMTNRILASISDLSQNNRSVHQNRSQSIDANQWVQMSKVSLNRRTREMLSQKSGIWGTMVV